MMHQSYGVFTVLYNQFEILVQASIRTHQLEDREIMVGILKDYLQEYHPNLKEAKFLNPPYRITATNILKLLMKIGSKRTRILANRMYKKNKHSSLFILFFKLEKDGKNELSRNNKK